MYLLADATDAVRTPQKLIAQLHAVLLREALEPIEGARFKFFLEAAVSGAALWGFAEA